MMETFSRRHDGDKLRLLCILAALTGFMMVSMPQHTAAENFEEKVHEQAEALIDQATVTWQNFMQDPDLSGFRSHLKSVQGVLIFPRLTKGAFIVGVEGGNGVLLARDEKTGSWSEPVFYEISSASFGLQAGVETSEAILVIETIKGVESLLSSTLKLGADASAVIGPKGTGVEGATSMSEGNDFVTYARTEGAFIGLSLEGASIRTRDDLNMAYYGSAVRPSEIMLFRNVKSNPHSQSLHQAVVEGADGKGSHDGRGTVN
jgi:SH3 domain-containing YSC84-like protein 1